MAITAFIRVSGLKFRGTFVEIWLYLWQQTETCDAVAMISLTAFRSVFAAAESSRVGRRPRKYGTQAPSPPSSGIRPRAVAMRKPSKNCRRSHLRRWSGMRTFIRGKDRVWNHRSTGSKLALEREPDEWPLYSRRLEAKGYPT